MSKAAQQQRQFQASEFHERLLALRETDPQAFARLGHVTLAMLRAYEASRGPAPAGEEKAAREHRATARLYIHLPAKWEGAGGVHEGTVSDLSTDGCFVLTSGEATVKELVRIFILLPRAGWVGFLAAVTNSHAGIGFGAQFQRVTTEAAEAVKLLFSIASNRPTSSATTTDPTDQPPTVVPGETWPAAPATP